MANILYSTLGKYLINWKGRRRIHRSTFDFEMFH